jgi:protocatechuate 3,4-dioxygenase beta subunit
MKPAFLLMLLLTLSAVGQPQTCRCKLPKASTNSAYDDPDRKHIYKKLYGQIDDLNGRPIPNLKVNVYSVDSQGQRKQPMLASCITDKHGLFCFPNVPRGTYELHVIDDDPRPHGPFENITLTVTIDPANRHSSKRPLITQLALRI